MQAFLFAPSASHPTRHFDVFAFLRRLLTKLPLLAGLVTVLLACSAFAASPSFVQGNSAVPQTPQANVKVTYTATQTVGNLNVVIAGWNDATAQVSSVTDTKGNVYQLAVGPTRLTGSGPLSQAIYYAKNIGTAAAGANTVTLTFNQAAIWADIRILEYSGIDPVSPVDVVVDATGNSATTSSGAVITKNAMDLLVAANIVGTGTTGPGSGFTQRMITYPDGDIAEDRLVTAVGSYSASAVLSSAGPWMMHMVAFRAASSPTPTPTPTPAPTPTPTPAALSYVQGNYAVPQSPLTTVTVPFKAAQMAGDLNVVIVGWNDSTTQVSSLTDSRG